MSKNPAQTILHNIEGPALISEIASLKDVVLSLASKVELPPAVEPITIADTAKFLGVSKPTIHSWINRGILKAYKVGNQTRLKRHEVEAALTEIQSKKGGKQS